MTTEDTTPEKRSSFPSLVVLALAAVAHVFAAVRLDGVMLPRDGGLPRAVALAAARAPELFVVLGALVAAAWITALLALAGSRRARALATALGAMLTIGWVSAVLSILPPRVTELWEAGDRSSLTQPTMLYSLGVVASAVQVVLVAGAQLRAAAREGGVRAWAREPALAAALAWIALAVPVRWMWWSRDDGPRPTTLLDACDQVLLLAIAIGLAQAALRTWHRRAGRP